MKAHREERENKNQEERPGKKRVRIIMANEICFLVMGTPGGAAHRTQQTF